MSKCTWTGGYLLVACDRDASHICHTPVTGVFYDNISCHKFEEESITIARPFQGLEWMKIEADGYVTVHPRLPVTSP